MALRRTWPAIRPWRPAYRQSGSPAPRPRPGTRLGYGKRGQYSDMTREEIARRAYEAFQSRDRETFEGLLADDFRFSSPHDPDLDRNGYFERCWPNMEHMRAIRLDRVVEAGDEVFVRYEVERTNGERFRNVELLTVRDGRIARVEVYYGAELG